MTLYAMNKLNYIFLFLVPITNCTATNTTSVITDDNGCTSNATISTCAGPCKSNTTVSVFGNQKITSNCRCCTPMDVKQETTQMKCPDGSTYVHNYPVIQACSCTRCGA